MDDIAQKVALLHQANGEFAEWHNGSLLLSISVEAFRDLAREHGDWINNHDRKTLALAEELPRAAEHQHDQLRARTRQPVVQPMQVAQVSADYGQGQGQGQARGRKRGKEVADKKQRTNCASCQDEGH
ncbi:hypothetical protein PI126_g18599 [Phytophthora idaei]|nr:hypothetical protein PI126_g18599 [Phytophthora idaei]